MRRYAMDRNARVFLLFLAVVLFSFVAKGSDCIGIEVCQIPVTLTGRC